MLRPAIAACAKDTDLTESSPLSAVLDRISRDQADSVERLSALVRIPSVSADPDRLGAVGDAAEWVRAELAALGFAVSVRPTARHPVVVAHHPGPGKDATHVLIYSHYDVQPPDPVELWATAPFEPLIKDGPHGPQLVGRGASDNKGQLISWLDALRAILAETGTLPVAVTVMCEGEEEIGSPNLRDFLKTNANDLKADVALLNDASMWAIDRPALVTRLRGMLYTQLDITGPAQDLHSGLYGGLVVNPLTLLSEILADLHDDERRIAVPGFYDDVAELDARDSALWRDLAFDEKKYLADVGLANPVGEGNRTTLERIWSRPTAEVNGIWGGYSGAGSKTVIPAEAHAKVSFRLVPGQDPKRLARLFEEFVNARLPADAKATVTVISASPATMIPTESVYVEKAMTALSDEFGRPTAIVGTGGTLPVVNAVKDVLGIDSLLYGWAQNDDNPHSPNEKFELIALEKGSRAHARILFALADIRP